MKNPLIDPIRINHTGIYLGDKPLPGVTRWTARHEPERAVFEIQLTLVTSACHVNLDAAPGQLLGGPLHAYAPPPAATPLQHLALLASLANSLFVLVAPADPQRLYDAAKAQGGSLPWVRPPAVAFEVLHGELAKAIDAAAKANDPHSGEMRAELRLALAQLRDPDADQAMQGRATLAGAVRLLMGKLDAALGKLAAPQDAAEQAGGAK